MKNYFIQQINKFNCKIISTQLMRCTNERSVERQKLYIESIVIAKITYYEGFDSDWFKMGGKLNTIMIRTMLYCWKGLK